MFFLASDVHMGQTLFLRNLSFDTTEKDVVDRYDTLTRGVVFLLFFIDSLSSVKLPTAS